MRSTRRLTAWRPSSVKLRMPCSTCCAPSPPWNKISPSRTTPCSSTENVAWACVRRSPCLRASPPIRSALEPRTLWSRIDSVPGHNKGLHDEGPYIDSTEISTRCWVDLKWISVGVFIKAMCLTHKVELATVFEWHMTMSFVVPTVNPAELTSYSLWWYQICFYWFALDHYEIVFIFVNHVLLLFISSMLILHFIFVLNVTWWWEDFNLFYFYSVYFIL